LSIIDLNYLLMMRITNNPIVGKNLSAAGFQRISRSYWVKNAGWFMLWLFRFGFNLPYILLIVFIWFIIKQLINLF